MTPESHCGHLPTYLNNAATTFPKPASVIQAVGRAISQPPVEPGRSGGGPDPAAACRAELAGLFGVPSLCRVILTPSATYSLNLVIQGVLGSEKQAHAITTVLEHNSVLRPFEHLRRDRGLEVTFLEPGSDGRLDPGSLLPCVRANTRLISVTHVSNVTGCVQPVEAMAHMAAELEIPMLIDASQSAGAVALDYGGLPGRVFVALAGHKGLYGPTGTGALVVPDDTLAQTFVGGTGVQSEKRLHPGQLPIRHEAGTMNLVGVAGLAEGVRFVTSRGLERLGQDRHRLVHAIRSALAELPGVRLSPLAGGDGRGGIVSFTLKGWRPEDLWLVLRDSFQIETRAGLHCAPMIHDHLGTAPSGSVRVGVGAFNTEEDVDRLVNALRTTVEVRCAG